MLDISELGIIKMNRGDSFSSVLTINCGSDICPQRYTLKSNDTLYFAVMECNQRFEDAIIKKVYTKNDETTEDGDTIITLSPSDTEFLLPDKYFYTIKLKTDLGEGKYDVQTIIPEKEFFIMR